MINKMERMLNRNVLVKVHSAETKTAGGLIIPASHKKNFEIATVVLPPEDQEELVKGDIVHIPKDYGQQVEVNKELLLIINIRDIISIK